MCHSVAISSVSIISLTLWSPAVSNGYTSHWLSARVPECQQIKNGGLDQYDPERFGGLIFVAVRKSVWLKGLTVG